MAGETEIVIFGLGVGAGVGVGVGLGVGVGVGVWGVPGRRPALTALFEVVPHPITKERLTTPTSTQFRYKS